MKGTTAVPSGYRNKNTKVRYSFVQDPQDPSGKTRVRTEHGKSSFEISLDNLEYVPLDSPEEHPETMSLDSPPVVDMSGHTEAPDLTEAYQNISPYGAVFHEPVTVKDIASRKDEAPHEFDYMALARSLPFNLGQALMHTWLAGIAANGEREQHLRQARFHLADEMQRTR